MKPNKQVQIYGLGLVSFLLSACYEKLDEPPPCFEIEELAEVSAQELEIRLTLGQANYCADENFSCQEIWTGQTKERLRESKDYYYFSYPYLSLIENEKVGDDSPFMICTLPTTCEEPECECMTSKDCSNNSHCVGDGLFGQIGNNMGKKTRCLAECPSQSINGENLCGLPGSTLEYCEAGDCLVFETRE